jgi:hypothetical protein
MKSTIRTWLLSTAVLVCVTHFGAHRAAAAYIWLDYIYWWDASQTEIAYGGDIYLGAGDYSPYVWWTYAIDSLGYDFGAYWGQQYWSDYQNGIWGYDYRVHGAVDAATYSTVYVHWRYYNSGEQITDSFSYRLYKE